MWRSYEKHFVRSLFIHLSTLLPVQVPIAPELRSHCVPGGQALAAVQPATQLSPTVSQYSPIGQEPGAHPEI